MGVHLLVSPDAKLWSWEGKVCWDAPAMSPLGVLEEHQSCCRESPMLSAVLLLPSDVGSHQLPLPSPCAVVQWGCGSHGPPSLPA